MTHNSPTTVTVHTIPIFPLGMINAFLVQGPNGCLLIDTGLPNSEAKIRKTLTALNLRFDDIKLIIITHAHIDHAGNTAIIKTLSGAPVIAHQADLPYFLAEQKMHFCSTGWFGRLFQKTGAIQKPYTPFMPDILLTPGQRFSLSDYGFAGFILPTPGHTAGSISVVLENNVALVGDLISSGILLGGIMCSHTAKRPPFEDDPLQVSHALQGITDLGVTRFYMGHGGPLTKPAVQQHIHNLKCINQQKRP